MKVKLKIDENGNIKHIVSFDTPNEDISQYQDVEIDIDSMDKYPYIYEMAVKDGKLVDTEKSIADKNEMEKNQKINVLTQWFEQYDLEVSKVNREDRLELEHSIDIDNEHYANIEALDKVAEKKRKELKELKGE